MKKKAAVCISGQLRNVESGFISFSPNVLDANKDNWNIDVFIHSWFDYETIGVEYPLWYGGSASSPISNDVLNKLYQYYNPKKMLLEKQIHFNVDEKMNERKATGCRLQVTYSKCHSIFAANELKKNYEKENDFFYDLVHFTRTDINYKEKVIYDNFDVNCLNASPHGVSNGIGVDVAFGIMSTEIANKYASIVDYLKYYWDTGTLFCDEHFLHRHTDEMQIPVNRTGLLASYDIFRK